VEKTGKTNLKRTENEASHVVENKGRAKKRTENKPKNKASQLVENNRP
jgi:ribosomal protein L35